MAFWITVGIIGLLIGGFWYNAYQAQKWHEEHLGVEKRLETAHYHWHIFYFNSDDGRIFVPKKSGGGYTINFANPVSILAGVLLIIGFILFVVLSGKG